VKAKKKGNDKAGAGNAAPQEKLKRKVYDKALTKLHVELVKLQEWVIHKGLKVCVVFEGGTARARAARSRRSPSA